MSRPNTFQVDVEAILLPPAASDAGIWVGRSEEGAWAGWGLATTPLVVQREYILALGDGPSPVGALLLPAVAMASAFRSIPTEARVGVVGGGLLGSLARSILAQARTVGPAGQGAALDVLVDMTGDPQAMVKALPGLRSEGTLLLFLPPWSGPVDFNFYPDFHRRSLAVAVRRWHRPPLGAGAPEALRRIASEFAASDRWVKPAASGPKALDGDAWGWMTVADRAMATSDDRLR